MEEGGERIITVTVELKEGSIALGAVPNERLVIIKVQAGSPAEGKLSLGDRIVKVNDEEVSDTAQLMELLRSSGSTVSLLVARPSKLPEELASLAKLPTARSQNVTPRDGFVYSIVRIEWSARGAKLGLGVKHYQSRVLVSRCDSGSLSAQFLRTGDRLIDVDGVPVSDKEVTRDLLISGLRQNKCVSMVVERAFTPAAAQKAKFDLIAASEMNPSVPMNSDVREIAARQRARYQTSVNAAPGMVVREEAPNERRVEISDRGPEVFVIASDHEGKKLRHVKRRK